MPQENTEKGKRVDIKLSYQTKIVVINKSPIMDDHIAGQLLLAKHQLETGKIEGIWVNEYYFTAKSFLTKTGRFNQSLYCDIMPWAYESEFMHKMANFSNIFNS